MSKALPKKISKALPKKIREKEAAFRKMTKAEKRVAIAKDVIEQLKAGKLEAKQGYWLQPHKSPPKVESDLREQFLQTTCTACVVGSLFHCAVLRHNKITTGGLIVAIGHRAKKWNINPWRNGGAVLTADHGSNSMLGYLEKFFSAEQLQLIEEAFELGGGVLPTYDHILDVEKAVDFGGRYANARERMMAIMQNIIENKGTFRP